MAAVASEAHHQSRPPRNASRSNRKRDANTTDSTAPRDEKITPADLEILRSNPSTATRSAFAAKFGRQYDAFAATSSKEFADTILFHLAKDVEAVVRKALAETVAGSPNLPKTLAIDLANDEINIAQPILEKCRVLEDPELVGIIQAQAMYHAYAVAGRAEVSDVVSDALIDTENIDAILRLLTNDGAQFSEQGLCRLADDFSGVKSIQAQLIKLPDLPAVVVERLIDGIGDALEWDLVKSRSIEPIEARQIAKAMKSQAAKAIATRGGVEQATAAAMQARMTKGALEPLDILRFLRDGNVGKFEAALATLAKIDSKKTKRLLYNMDKRALAALCIRCELGTPQYMAIRMALDLADMGVNEVRASRVKYPAKTFSFIQDQYERLRKDEKVVGQFL
ncbi:MAG: DUF2336 domain-containing protein [Pseudomonadota bacterium]